MFDYLNIQLRNNKMSLAYAKSDMILKLRNNQDTTTHSNTITNTKIKQ